MVADHLSYSDFARFPIELKVSPQFVTTASHCLFKLSKQKQKGSAETTSGEDEGKNKKDINSLLGFIICCYTNSAT